ncbi:MAG: transcription termination/antitermination protein NusG [Thermoguttaceae bacterium]|nr:transcription termination/antitermination protein NusG [Thermoguttaceae bacterium]MDW8038875.1 transcription termination/antitermination protein NusG [Thermoguttaceae bacterium]
MPRRDVSGYEASSGSGFAPGGESQQQEEPRGLAEGSVNMGSACAEASRGGEKPTGGNSETLLEKTPEAETEQPSGPSLAMDSPIPMGLKEEPPLSSDQFSPAQPVSGDQAERDASSPEPEKMQIWESPSNLSVQTVEPSVPGAPSEPAAQQKPPDKPPKSDKMEWYILKVQTNREESIREGLLRRAAIAGLDHYFGEIIIPTEKVTEFKGGKKRITTRKLYPGYLVVQMELNDETWFLVRETPGIGDFTGAIGRPSPLPPHEVNRILAKKEERPDEIPKLKIGFQLGDKVKITEGTFENFEGEVSSIDETNGRVTVMISIFNRTTPVEFEYWQLEKV